MNEKGMNQKRFQNIEVSLSKENNCKPYHILNFFEYDRFLEKKLLISEHTASRAAF